MKFLKIILGYNFVSYVLKTFIFVEQFQIYKCLKLSIRLIYTLNRVDGTNLLRILYKIYIVVFRASLHIKSSIEEKLIILRIISIRV